MSVENKYVIDIIGIDQNGSAALTISDHLLWDNENEHLLILQNKINTYLEAIETGELYEKYPNAKNKPIVIRVVALYNPNEDGLSFLEQVGQILTSAGYGFEFSQNRWIAR
jgi:hypothetical protein